MTTAIPAHLVDAIGTLCAPQGLGWRDDTWQYRVLGMLHEDAVHMDRKRTRRPFTARDLSEREWYAQRRDPVTIAAAESAYAAHKVSTPAVKMKRAKGRSLATYYALAVQASLEARP